MSTVYAARFETRLGPMAVAVDEDGAALTVDFLDAEDDEERVAARLHRSAGGASELRWDARACAALVSSVEAFLDGRAREHPGPLAPRGTPFQQRVWAELRRIPYGETISYAELARRIGSPTAVRAVARASGANPIAIFVPCHRVIGADGSLTGYAGGLERKRALLELEARHASPAQGSLFP